MSKQDKFYETLRQTQTNTFSDGLNMDLHPLTTPNTILTDCVNGTMITYNDNEFVLQNDRGNSETNCKLSKGYYPVAMKEYNGILYIISHNPEEQKTEIGSYPAPTQNNDHLTLTQNIIYPWLECTNETCDNKFDDSNKTYFVKSDLERDVCWFEQKEKQRVSMIDSYELAVESAPIIYKLQFYAKSVDGTVEPIDLYNTVDDKPKHFPNKYLAYLGYKYITPSIDNLKFIRTDSGNPKENGDDLVLEYVIESSDKFLYESVKSQLNKEKPNFKICLYTRSYFYNESDEKEFDLLNIIEDSGTKQYVKWTLSKVEDYGSTYKYFFIMKFTDSNNAVAYENFAPKIYWPSNYNFAYDFDTNELTIRTEKYSHFCVEAYPVVEFLYEDKENNRESMKTFYLENDVKFTSEVQNIIARNEWFSEFKYKKVGEKLDITATLNVENFFNKKLSAEELEDIVCTAYSVSFSSCNTDDGTNAQNISMNNINWQQKDELPTGIEGTYTGISVDENDNPILTFSPNQNDPISGGIENQCVTLSSNSAGIYTNPESPSIQYSEGTVQACYVAVNGKFIEFSYIADIWKEDSIYDFELCFDVIINSYKKAVLQTNLKVQEIKYSFETNITINKPTNLLQPSIIKLGTKGIGEQGKKVHFPVITTSKMLKNADKVSRMDKLPSSAWFDTNNIEKMLSREIVWGKDILEDNIDRLGGCNPNEGGSWLEWLSNYNPTSTDPIILPNGEEKFDLNTSVIPCFQRKQTGQFNIKISDEIPAIYKICKLYNIKGNNDITYTPWSSDVGSSQIEFNVKAKDDTITINLDSIQQEWVSGNQENAYLATKRNYLWPYIDPDIGNIDNLESPERIAYTPYTRNSIHFECNHQDSDDGLRISAGPTPKKTSCARNLVGDAIDWYYERREPLDIYLCWYDDFYDPTDWPATKFKIDASDTRIISYLNVLFSMWQWCGRWGYPNSGESDEHPVKFSGTDKIAERLYKDGCTWGFVNDSTGEPRLYARCLPYNHESELGTYNKKYNEELCQLVSIGQVKGIKYKSYENFIDPNIRMLSGLYNSWVVGCEGLDREQYDESMKTLCTHCYYVTGKEQRNYYKWENSKKTICKWIASTLCTINNVEFSICENIKSIEWESKNNFNNCSVECSIQEKLTNDKAAGSTNLGSAFFNEISNYYQNVNNSIDIIDTSESNPFKQNDDSGENYVIYSDIKKDSKYWTISNKDVNNWNNSTISIDEEPLNYKQTNNIWTLRKDNVNGIDRAMIYCRFWDTDEDSQHFVESESGRRVYYKTNWIFNNSTYDLYNQITPQFYKWYKTEVLKQ